jgi:hypothetical protein
MRPGCLQILPFESAGRNSSLEDSGLELLGNILKQFTQFYADISSKLEQKPS